MSSSFVDQCTPFNARNYDDDEDIEAPRHTFLAREHPPPKYGKCAFLYYRYINPWIRLLFALVIVYFYAVLLNITTYRTARMGELTLNWPQVDDLTIPRPDGRGVYLVLEDLLYTQIPRSGLDTPAYEAWKTYLDFCAFFFNALVLAVCILRRDFLRLVELIGLHSALYICMFFSKIITLYPVPQMTDGCLNPEHRELGLWIWTQVFTTDFCGDQMFSGHTNNTLLPMIILTRILYDIVGWDFYLCGNKDSYHEPEYTNVYHISDHNPIADYGTFVDHNEDLFLHPRYSFKEPRARHTSRQMFWFWAIVTVSCRLLKWIIMGVFVYGLLRNRQHYTADIMVSIMVQLILSSNTNFVQNLVRWLYRPNYWNYKRTGLFALVKLRQPLTPEQANYEDRLSKLGKGGLF